MGLFLNLLEGLANEMARPVNSSQQAFSHSQHRHGGQAFDFGGYRSSSDDQAYYANLPLPPLDPSEHR